MPGGGGAEVAATRGLKARASAIQGDQFPILKLNPVSAKLYADNATADPRLLPGGGAAEMAVSRGLKERASAI